MAKKLTNWKNEPTLEDLMYDYKGAEDYRNHVVAQIEQYRTDMNGGDPLPKHLRERGKSTVQPLVIRKMAEWAYPTLEEPFMSTYDVFSVQPTGPEDANKAYNSGLWLNWAFNVQVDKTKLITEIVRTVYDEGTVIVKDGWATEYDEKEVEAVEVVYGDADESYEAIKNMVQLGKIDQIQAQALIETGEPVPIGKKVIKKKVKCVVSNKPTLEVVDNTNVVVDPTCEGDIQRARFIIHEYDEDFSTLKAQEYQEYTAVDPITGEEKKVGSGLYKNLDKIDLDSDSEDVSSGTVSDTKQFGDSFHFKDKARKKIKIKEYWGYWDIDKDGEVEPIIAVWAGDTMIRLAKNPFPHKELPFSIARYMPRKKEVFGEPDAKLLKENQDTVGVYTRAMHNQTITNSLGQKLVDETLFSSPSQWQAFNKGLNARFRNGADPSRMIWTSKIEPIDGSIFNMITYQKQDAESLTGQKAFQQGVTGDSLGTSVGGIRSALDATAKRKLSILRRISEELLRNVARHMLLNAKVFLDDSVMVKLSDGEFQEFDRSNLDVDFDLRIEISTPEKDQDTSNKLSYMMQTMGPNLPFELTQLLMAKWAKLNKVPDVAKAIEEIEPPKPDPMEEEMRQLQLENERLKNELMKADIGEKADKSDKLRADTAKTYATKDNLDAYTYETMARYNDAPVHTTKVMADAEVAMAKAKKLESDRDVVDKKFIDEATGVDRQRQIEDQQFKADMDVYKHSTKQQGDRNATK